MKTQELRLPLKAKWFEITKAGIKTEDYREINDYWKSRLFYGGFSLKKSIRYSYYINGRFYEVKKFTNNTITLGYPSNDDKERILKLEHKGIEIGYGKEEWGAEPNKLYFIIKHGKIIS